MSESARVSGIYAITHVSSGRTYVGASVDVARRFKRQRYLLKRGWVSPRMREDWERDGVDAFRFELLETGVSRDDLSKREDHWMQTLANVYNVRPSLPHVWRPIKKLTDAERLARWDADSAKRYSPDSIDPFYRKEPAWVLELRRKDAPAVSEDA